MKTIDEALKECGLFPNLTQEKLQHLRSKIETIEVPASKVFIHEGEKAESLFIILEGVAEVFCFDDFNREMTLNAIKEGNYFGEQSLISITPGIRNASVRALTDLTLIKIDHAAYLEFEDPESPVDEKLMEIGFHQLLVKFKKRSEELDIAKCFFYPEYQYDLRIYEKGETIVDAGEPSDGMYFIVSGTVEIYKSDKLVSTLQAGCVFGELGVIRQQVRSATAKATTTVKTIFLSNMEFFSLSKQKPEVQYIIESARNTYNTDRGEVIQFMGNFLGMPAILSHFYMKDGGYFIASSVMGTHLYSIITPQKKVTSHVIYMKHRNYRELHFMDGHIIGITSFGIWDNLDFMYEKVFENAEISPESLEYFRKTGEIMQIPIMADDILCSCLCIKRTDKDKKGLGTVCGACLRKN